MSIGYFNQNINFSFHKNAFEIVVCEMAAILSGGRWVKAVVVIFELEHKEQNDILIPSVCASVCVW